MIIRFHYHHIFGLDPALAALWRETLDVVKGIQQGEIDRQVAALKASTDQLADASKPETLNP